MKKIVYDEYHDFLQKRTLKSKLYRNYWLYPKLSKYLTGTAIDIGSGIGDFVKFRPHTIGVDINPDNVEFCKSQGLDVRLMGIDRLPFKDNEVDSINMDNVLEHIEDPLPILTEMDRVLKYNGNLVIGVPGILGFRTAPDHEIYYSEEDLVELFTGRGYKLKQLFYMPFKWDWLDTHMRQYCYYGVFVKR